MTEVMNRLAILGGTGLGVSIVNEAVDYDVKVYDVPDFNIYVKNSMMVLGRVLQRTRPDVFVFNASGPNTEEHGSAKINALKTLWPFVKVLDISIIIISSAGAWNSLSVDDPNIRIYRKINFDLSNVALSICRKSTMDEHQARTILFEPAIYDASVAKKFNSTYLTNKEMWDMIKLGIDAKLPFIRLGCQGNNV